MKHLKKFNESNSNEYGEYIISELNRALRQFGIYTYQDKGASEIMSLSKIDDYLKSKSADEVAEILKYVLDNDNNSARLVDEIISNLDYREDFDDILSKDERFEY